MNWRQLHPGRMSVIHRTGKLGLATAYLQAFQTLFKSNVDAIVHMDCDFSHDPAVLVEMAKCIESCDVVFGSRYIPGGSTDVRWSLWRKALSAWGNFYARSHPGPVHPRCDRRDSGCGGGRRSNPCRWNGLNPADMYFMVEMSYLADCMGLKICETPIHFADRRWGKSKMSFKIQAEAALRVWSVLWNYRDLRAKRVGR